MNFGFGLSRRCFCCLCPLFVGVVVCVFFRFLLLAFVSPLPSLPLRLLGFFLAFFPLLRPSSLARLTAVTHVVGTYGSWWFFRTLVAVPTCDRSMLGWCTEDDSILDLVHTMHSDAEVLSFFVVFHCLLLRLLCCCCCCGCCSSPC